VIIFLKGGNCNKDPSPDLVMDFVWKVIGLFKSSKSKKDKEKWIVIQHKNP